MKVKLVYWAWSSHLQQIFTGFIMLAKAEKIDLSFEFRPYHGGSKLHMGEHLAELENKLLYVEIDESVRLIYDAHDSWEIDEFDLSSCDFYFKRSYAGSNYNQFGQLKDKIKPLGLNYFVTPDFDSIDYYRRSGFGLKESFFEAIKRRLPNQRFFLENFFIPTVSRMNSAPDAKCDPKILYMVRTWDPYDQGSRSQQKVEMREEINEMRAKCISNLKKQFGKIFYGGFSHTEFAKARYPKLLVDNTAMTSKGRYIYMMKNYPICVSSTGLHGSTGWKMGEYVAFSKSIVSEELCYEVPGCFSEGKNYLSFDSADSCVENVSKLVDDGSLRESMMKANREYYINHLSPDRLVLNTLNVAKLGAQSSSAANQA